MSVKTCNFKDVGAGLSSAVFLGVTQFLQAVYFALSVAGLGVLAVLAVCAFRGTELPTLSFAGGFCVCVSIGCAARVWLPMIWSARKVGDILCAAVGLCFGTFEYVTWLLEVFKDSPFGFAPAHASIRTWLGLIPVYLVIVGFILAILGKLGYDGWRAIQALCEHGARVRRVGETAAN